jgi:hypothetical protein
VPLGSRLRRVEPGAVVLQFQHEVIAVLSDRDPHVRGASMLQRVHHALASDVEDEEGDRCRQRDLLNVSVEEDPGISADLVRERLERLR